ncbi:MULTISPECIES: MFS transporter [unclassified Streptomyces]|uniref:MFS transporter n=1 Tax=unclassified Streptomyces TaxID=2593676 RepID=UPI0011C92BB0|nr:MULTISPECIES: MFS transporter [unclassified Streptomyces]TXS12963.1 MFS transporter [Streptomyces sp. wa22]WSQ80131.1 MFS transporter [Streptomyces sp. NBC_01213]WSR06527.1 MFS transporter [Streptomyces sp. NBC_01208]WSR50811.1 MFS transporter [Streptomyces sp. NBC_01201]
MTTEAEVAVAPPLSRNRNYHMLWGSQLVSELVSQLCLIAFPLMVMATTGSAPWMGAVAAVIGAAGMVANVPAGVLVDRFDRKWVMLVCQCVRAVAMASLAIALLADHFSLSHVFVVAVVEGLLGAAFDPAEHAALPQVVHESQLSTAVARNTTRRYIATLLGPASAGFLFAFDPTAPFAVALVLLVASCVVLSFLRLPRPEPEVRPEGQSERTGMLVEGFRWVLGHRVIRPTLVWLMCCELFISALITIVLALSGEDGMAPGTLGMMMTGFGIGGLLGAAVAGRLHAVLPAPAIIMGFPWCAAALTLVMALVPTGVSTGVVLGGIAFLIPTAFTTVMTYQLAVAPAALRGRLSGIVGLFAGGAGAIGSLVGGLLMADGDSRGTLLIWSACLVVVAVGTIISPALRRFPTLK